MVLLVFEGVDNLGKSTIINKLAEKYKNDRDIVFMHATGPVCKDGEDPNLVQDQTFNQMYAKCNYISNLETIYPRTRKNIVFMDRSECGEYVYGQIYRQRNSDDIILSNKYLRINPAIIKVIIHLEASPNFVVSHDDNKSFTSNYDSEKRLNTVIKEIDLFNEYFTKTKPTNYIKINVEGTENNYRNIDELCDEILSKLKEINVEL